MAMKFNFGHLSNYFWFKHVSLLLLTIFRVNSPKYKIFRVADPNHLFQNVFLLFYDFYLEIAIILRYYFIIMWIKFISFKITIFCYLSPKSPCLYTAFGDKWEFLCITSLFFVIKKTILFTE